MHAKGFLVLASYIYKSSPVWAQEAMLSLRAACRGLLQNEFRYQALLGQAEERQYWNAEQLQGWSMEHAEILIQAARKRVPFYRERDAHHGDRYEINQLPLLEKSEVRNAALRLLPNGRRPCGSFKSSTSGTKGSPLVLYQPLDAFLRENAFQMRQLQWAGYSEGAKRVCLQGEMIVPAAVRKPPYWRVSSTDNMLMMSSFHLSETSVPGYLDAMRRFDPVIIQAYPSSIGFLANWMLCKGTGVTLHSLRAIVTSSEALSVEQRRKIEAGFGVPVFDWYGNAERVAAIGTCEFGNYHVMDDYGFIEFLHLSGTTHEVIGTGLNNDSMPLIRYRTGDTVELGNDEYGCECGRAFRRISAINGRIDDVIKTPDGRVVGRLDQIYNNVTGIIEGQISQHALDRIVIRVVPISGIYSEKTALQLVTNLRGRVGMDIDIKVEAVNALERNTSGKLSAVVSAF